MTTACRICQNVQGNGIHIAREMMFGLRDEFRYLECAACGCLQLLDIPADWSRYYPSEYSSLRPAGGLKTFLRHQWAAYTYGNLNPIGWAIAFVLDRQSSVDAVRKARISKNASILDVGCGTGYLLRDLRHLGFQQLSGVDPHIPSDLVYPGDIRVRKCSIANVDGSFDVIMLHHSFEHMDDPLTVMQHIARLLNPGGIVLLRIPIADSDAWRRYGVNWCNLDAPRHIFLHTRRSIDELTRQAGLRVTRCFCDSTDAGPTSLQFARNVALTDPGSLSKSTLRMLWVRRNPWAKHATNALNADGKGDTACFVLTK